MYSIGVSPSQVSAPKWVILGSDLPPNDHEFADEKSHDREGYESPTATHPLSLLQSTCSIRTDLGSSGTNTPIATSPSSIIKPFRRLTTSPA